MTTSVVSLAKLTTFGIGGLVRRYLRVRTPAELVDAVRAARAAGERYVILAGGSNVVFDDRLFGGTIIHYLNHRARLDWQGATLTVVTGLPLAVLIKRSIARSLAGLEALSGIPGTVGGAIVGNAGAYGQCVSDHLVEVEIFSPYPLTSSSKGRGGNLNSGETRWLTRADCCFAYRDSIFKRADSDLIILRAKFKLVRGDGKKLAEKSRGIIAVREGKYPPGLKCPGSFFKNVLVKGVPRSVLAKLDRTKIIDGKIPAGYLLEAVGACGQRQGGLRVADYHGNLIINDGRATYCDVIALASRLKKLVSDRFGIALEEEVRYVT